MPDTATRRVLLCGGPLAGHWVDNVPLYQSDIRAIAPRPPALNPSDVRSGDALLTASLEVIYAIRRLELNFWSLGQRTLWVGQLVAPQSSRQLDTDLTEALFQRDVVQHLLGQR